MGEKQTGDYLNNPEKQEFSQVSNSEKININEIRELFRNLPKFDFFAYGGNKADYRAANERGKLQTVLGLPDRFLGDSANIPTDREKELSKICFGTSSVNNQRFLVIRNKQNMKERGGYAYSMLFDLGEEVYKSVNYNYALIIDKMLNNPDLRDKMLNNPEALKKEDFKVLGEADWNENLEERLGLLEEIKSYQGLDNIPGPVEKSLNDWDKDWITPGQMAEALSRLTPEQKKDFNWMVGAGGTWQRLGGVKLAYHYKVKN